MSQAPDSTSKDTTGSMFSSFLPGTSSSTDSSEPSNTSIFTKLVNKVQYVTSKSLDDPKAAEFAREKAIQDAQDQAVADRKAKEKALAAKQLEDKDKADAKVKDLQERSQFNITRATGGTASGILKIFGSLLLAGVMMYGGHLAANQAIGYNAPFRLLTFLYGSLFFFYHIPKGLYDKYINKKKLEFYSFLPLSTYHPTGDLEKFFIGPFCYSETQESQAARAVVQSLYSTAFTKSQIKTN